MRKKLSIVLLAICMVVCMLALVACNDTPDAGKPEHNHTFDQRVATNNYLASEATCTEPAKYYYSCTCGEKGTETFADGNALGHTFDRKVATSEYLVSEANCTEPAKYYYSCKCGEKGTETFTDGTALGHTFAKNWSYNEKEHWHAATCGHTDEVADKEAHDLVLAADGLSKSCECGYKEDCIVDVDVLLEAEDAVLNPNHISIDESAHGGKYALDFNDCGQGMYFRYYAYEAGERKVDVAYATGMDYSYMTMFVNGQNGVRVDFSEVNGWFGDAKIMSIATVTINVEQGWNEIYLIKNGTDADNYGGYAQIDYIKVKGTGKDYTGQTFDRTVYSYKFEAETAEWHWTNTSQRPIGFGGNFSLGYGLGEMNAAGDGVKFTFVAKSTGTYKVRLAYGQSGDVQVNVFINGELVNENAPLSNGTAGWDDVKLDNSGITIDLVEGETYTIDFQQAGLWYVPDYLVLELVK